MALVFELFFTLNSCSDEQLDISNPNSPTPESFWQNEDHAEGGLVAVYAPLPTIPYVWKDFGRNTFDFTDRILQILFHNRM